jgi:hypothetical protein
MARKALQIISYIIAAIIAVKLLYSLGSYLNFLLYKPPTVAVDGDYVNQLISIINNYRQGNGTPPLQYSQVLSDFAESRFQRELQNINVLLYGFNDDADGFLENHTEFSIILEVELFPTIYEHMGGRERVHNMTIQEAIQDLVKQGFLSDFMDPTYTHYGYYVGMGRGWVGDADCVEKIPSDIYLHSSNIYTLLLEYGCNPELRDTVYLIIILAG